jgi:hypothetical protein
MAARLHPDDAKGQNNWADIEDDDEDWTPETITWKDGTKVALSHTDEVPPPPEPEPEPAPRQAVKEDGAADKVKLPPAGPSAGPPASLPASSPAGPPPSIKTGVLASGKGLVLKGVPEKPTLVAKPPAPPTPAKSPWAPLPKIERVSPVTADMPSQAGTKYPPRDTATHRTNLPPPPKEIAADDFSRAPWRDGAPGANRELFNSQSGRYEPVVDRRGQMRPEVPHGRQPALLQRPLHHDQQGPIEPNGAFQAGSNNEQPGPYGRRRGSSNVSGGSGSWQRLRGLEHPLPPSELTNARRESMTGRSDGPASPSGLQGGPQHGQGWQTRASPGVVHATPYQQAGQAPDGRSMMPPPAQQPAAVPVTGVTEEDYELQKKLMRERRELARRRREEEEAKEEAARRERIRLKLEALGPAPEANSTKKTVPKDHAKEQASTPTQIQARENLAPQKPAPSEETQAPENAVPAAAGSESVNPPALPPNGVQAQPLPPSDSTESRSQPHGANQARSWAPAARPTDRHPAVTWGAQPSTANVWGAPNNNRSLGNGTFAVDIGAPQIPQVSGPGPIAPPNGARAATSSQPAVPAPAPAPRLPPIGPPRRASRNEQVSGRTAERETKDNPWAAAVRLNDDKFSEMLNVQYEERDRRLQAEGRSVADIQPVIKDTWRPTKLDDSGVRTEDTAKQTLKIGQESPWAASTESNPTSSQQAPSAVSSAAPSEYGQLAQSAPAARDMTSASILGAKTAAPQQGRGSRFFPSRDIRQELSVETARPKSPSPPPPDMAGHPAFDGDATHPHVSLPRPHPVVRLPPSAAKESEGGAPALGQPRIQAPSFAWATQAAYKGEEGAPRKSDNMWQARIDSLLGGRKVHPKSTGAEGLRFPHHQQPAFPAEKDGSVTTKGMSEECFEEQEMGSVPPIRIPNMTPEMAWQPSPEPKALHKKLYAVVSSGESITFPVDMSGAGTIWHVRLPGNESKSITVPFGRARSNPRRGGPRGGRHPTAPRQSKGQGRETPSYSTEQQSTSAPRSNAPQGRNSRGGYRGRDNWSRNAPAQIQT